MATSLMSTSTKHPIKTSRLYKWLFLVVALVILSAFRYYQWSVQEIQSVEPVETKSHKKHAKRNKKIPPPHPAIHSPADDNRKPNINETEVVVVGDDNDKRKHSGKKTKDSKAVSSDKADKKHTKKSSEKKKHSHSTNETAVSKAKSAKDTSEKSVSDKEKKKRKSHHGSSKHYKSSSSNENSTTNETTTTKPTKNETTVAKEETAKQQENTTESLSFHNNHTASFSSLIPPHDKKKASLFSNSSCIVSHSEEWFPISGKEEWQLRAPRFMIIGARDAGTRMISSLLLQQHSAITSNFHANQKVAFFSQPSFVRRSQQQRIHVWKARQQMYAKHYPFKVLQKNTSLVTMDATPDYLFFGALVIRSILCVCPWIQIVVILRNPADRVYASFRRACQNLGWKGSLEEYVRLDMETMERAGLLGTNKKENQEEAWRLYLAQTQDGPVGRSFYELQLQQWFQALREMGRDPNQALRVIRYEEWKAFPEKQYPLLVDFLGLPKDGITAATTSNSNTTSSSFSSQSLISEEEKKTMARLRKFFRPYNKRLYKLLGDEWDGCWDDDE